MENIDSQNQFDLGDSKFGLGIRSFDYTLYGDNAACEWKKWMRSFECFMVASGVKDSARKCALLLHFAGEKVQELYATLPDNKNDDKVLRGPLSSTYVLQNTEFERAVEKLNGFFFSKKNITYERFMLRQIYQKLGESVGNFSIRLRVQAEKCDFGDGLETSIKEVLISNCDETLRKDLMKLMVMKDVDLESLVKAAKGIEAVNKQCKTLKSASKPQTQFTLDEVNRIGTNGRSSQFKRRASNANIECYRCGNNGHYSSDENCPAKNKQCNRCGGKGHFMVKCRSIKRENVGWNNNNQTNRYETASSTLKRSGERDASTSSSTFKRARADEPVRLVVVEEEDEYVFGISDDDTFTEEDYDPGNKIQCKIGGIDSVAIIDSGSKRNLMDENTWKWFKTQHIVVVSQQKQTDQRFRAYGNRLLTNLGVFDAMLQIYGNEIRATFYVVKEQGPLCSIVASVFYSIVWVVFFEGFQEAVTDGVIIDKRIYRIAISFLPSFVVIIMSIILLIGTIQKHVGCLRAWIIYQIAVLACVIPVFSTISQRSFFDLYKVILVDLVVIALNIFALVLVYIHMKEINEGVFDLHPKQPVTTSFERKLCGGRASTWTPVIAWILIVTNTTYVIAVIFFLVFVFVFVSLPRIEKYVKEIGLFVAAIIYFSLGTITAFILLKGTIQKRVGFLRVWLIYGGAALAVSILSIFWDSISIPIQANIIEYTNTSVQMALQVFALLVVYIHRKEINEGVFDLQPKQPVTTVLERTILCVGASIWTPLIAWIQIIANTTNLIAAISIDVYSIILNYRYHEVYFGYYSETVSAALAISVVFSLLGIIMAIILLKGTNKKRVGYLRAWLIYGGATIAVSVILIIVIATVTEVFLYHVVLEVAFNIFSLAVIYIHQKEIIGGIFDLYPKVPVTVPESQSETIYLQ